MFLVKQSLVSFVERFPDRAVFDASQGDGGASLPGVPPEILEGALELQLKRGTAYDQPYGTQSFRRSVLEDYWQVDPGLGLGPENVIAAVGGRDALLKAYQAMLALGYGRQGDAVIVSRVPWISYNWGPYGVGANTLLAPGRAEDGWAYSPESIQASVEFAAAQGRKVAGLVITSPDNPTGRTLSPDQQIQLAHAALRAGVSFVLFDWMYHFVTDEEPMDLNRFLAAFDPADRDRLMFLDGLTKSLGASNIRNAHLIASQAAIKLIVAIASHGVIPTYFGQAVAMTAYRSGYRKASRGIVDPTNASRMLVQQAFDARGYEYILGKGYYAFLNVGEWMRAGGWADSAALGQYLAHEHGLAVVPGVFFSPFGADWVRFSYATPPEVTRGALERLAEALVSLS
jgi:aspartate/methionine/tyrosine aminotransferase